MDAKSLTVLEFDKIRRRLADFTSFSGGRRLALDLLPEVEPDAVRARLRLTREASDFIDRKGRPPIAGAHDMRREVDAAERGRTLITAELLDIRHTLEAARRMRRTLLRDNARWPTLAEIADRLEECPALYDSLTSALSDEGEVLDSASPDLGKIRRQLRIAHERLTRQVEQILQGTRVREFLQEPIVTQRAGRYVIPVKAQFRSKVPGVVHDTSDSGATVFIEPLAVVEHGNRYRELAIDEEKEVERILRDLSSNVGAEAPSLRDTIFGLAELDLAYAAADYNVALRGIVPELVEQSDNQPFLDYRRARHPLLDQESVVPIDVRVGDEFRLLVITGPNTGGKTVTLKTVGLLTLMAQSGLGIPAADGSRLAVFDGVYADIGDEQSIEQSLSTFSGHLTNIVRILESASRRSLVLLDELGAGTDPVEGASLAVSLLDHLRSRDIATVASTHYSELKGYAHSTDGVMNASVEFDLETLQPTYELVLGLPGRSNALSIASRLGLDDAIVEAARSGISTQAVAMEDLLAEIRDARRAAAEDRDAAQAVRSEADAWAKKLEGALKELERERDEVLRQARLQAAEELETARKTSESLVNQAREAAALGHVADVEGVAERLREAQATVETEVPARPVPKPDKPADPDRIEPGTLVRVPRYGQDAEVLDVRSDGSVEVAMGALRTSLAPEEIEVIGQPDTNVPPTRGRRPTATAEAVPLELDLRGLRVDEGLRELDQRLDRAVLAGLPWVHVIHGHGTGAMKAAVREALSKHPQVKRFRPGEQGEGGDGVSIVHLK